MPNNNIFSEMRIINNSDVQEDNAHKTDFCSSKSVFEGYFRVNDTLLHINTNNKQVFINTLVVVIRYLNRVR